MNRRQLLTLPIIASLAPLASLWPFEEVSEFIQQPCGNPDCPDQMDCPYAFNYRYCDLCDGRALDDIFEDSTKPWRKFYRSLDGHNTIVCEHCTAAYLRENVPMQEPRP